MSVGSCSSAISRPAPIACGVPAGTKTASPACTGTGTSAPSSASWSWSRTHAASVSAATSSRNPTCTAVPACAAPMTIQASVFPNAVPRCSAAKAPSGWTWTGSRSPASSSFTSSAGSGPKRRTCAAPSHGSGSARIASRSSVPSGEPAQPAVALAERRGRRADPFLRHVVAVEADAAQRGDRRTAAVEAGDAVRREQQRLHAGASSPSRARRARTGPTSRAGTPRPPSTRP